ncbi:unnamed protein product [Auanema sp. JU1783]|nr:unnamed protein product [Auanema sp. JU1783]
MSTNTLNNFKRTAYDVSGCLHKKKRKMKEGKMKETLLVKIKEKKEVHSIVDDLSIRLGSVGEEWLTTSAVSPKYFEFTPIEMFAITKRLGLAEPTAPDSKMAADIGNTIDFLHRVRALKVRGAKGYVGSSNIVWNSLEFSLQFCKSLLALWITDSDVLRIKSVWTLKDSIRRLVIHYSMKQIKDLLLDEEPPIPISEMEAWTSLEEADFSFNEVEELDETVRLLGKVQVLNLSHNSLKDIGPHLQHLTNLTELNLSHNSINCVKDWNLVLGNIKKLTLAGNQIENVEGLSKLYSLEYLDLKENKIETIESMQSLGRLPCLEVLILRGNLVRKIVDYRSKAFEVFGDRAKEIQLDSRLADARELDTVRVRLALKQAKLEKEEKERKRRERIKERVRYISGEVDSLKPGSL